MGWGVTSSDDVSHFLGGILGVNSVAEVHCTGFSDGDCLWSLSLGRLTGDGKFDGETFLGRLWMFFSGWGGGDKRQHQVTFRRGQCSLDDTRCQTDPFFYVVYYIDQWGFRFFMLQTITNGAPRCSMSWGDT